MNEDLLAQKVHAYIVKNIDKRWLPDQLLFDEILRVRTNGIVTITVNFKGSSHGVTLSRFMMDNNIQESNLI